MGIIANAVKKAINLGCDHVYAVCIDDVSTMNATINSEIYGKRVALFDDYRMQRCERQVADRRFWQTYTPTYKDY